MKLAGAPLDWIAALALLGLMSSCRSSAPQPSPPKPQPSSIKVEVQSEGSVVIATSAAEFDVSRAGRVKAFLLNDGKKRTLDDPDSEPGGIGYAIDEKRVEFIFDTAQARVLAAQGKLGRGMGVEIPGYSRSDPNLQATIEAEAYDDFPNILLTSTQYKNAGSGEVTIHNVVDQQHWFNAALVDGKAHPYDMWSFQGASYDWGKDDVMKLSNAFSHPNVMGGMVKGGYGGGIPVVAFWTASVGEAIGHIETLPLSLSLPVAVQGDGRVSAAMEIPAETALKPAESYSTPRSFVSVYAGDFYKPLRLWSSVLQKEGWEIPKPSSEAYNVSWCGWGYEADVTPAQMLGTVPKLKEFGIKWATLDDRWFDNYGDWNPRTDTFPGDSIQRLVQDFHKQGILVQIWWLPLGVEDGEGRYEAHKYLVSQVTKDHPEWLILDQNGKHARMVRDLATLCPAVPEVQAYYKRLTEKFIHDWDFDGSKLDNIYTVPACYNPAHHHKSPFDSVNAMSEVYKTIFQTTRALKPQSVTQSCPCGTPPSLAWLPYMDQAVTADPVGAIQVRRRIKMYKALLGPEAAVYGDHVELSAMSRAPGKNDDWIENGDDFASTVGTGGVVGTKFVWPDPGPKFKRVLLTQQKEAHWKKWIGIYNEKMLSKGTFLDLYVYGYDVPEAYAIEKGGKMYYAFFAPKEDGSWKGDVELRGLKVGTYHVTDYGDGRDLGLIQADGKQAPKLKTDFHEHLLLEVSPQ